MASPLANPPTRIQPAFHADAERRLQRAYLHLPVPLRLWHLTSLDAPTVAVVWSLSFARTAGVHLPMWVPLLLALGTWAVYIGDRLLDAGSALRAGNIDRLRERHYFHWTHRRILTPCAIVAGVIAAAIILLLMPVDIRKHDFVLALAAFAYFSGVHFVGRPRRRPSSIFSKELLVGVLFTSGCAFPALSRLPISGNLLQLWPFFAVITFFALLAWLNCHAIDRWESSRSFGICRKWLRSRAVRRRAQPRFSTHWQSTRRCSFWARLTECASHRDSR